MRLSRSLSPCCSTVTTDLSLLNYLLIWLLLRCACICCSGRLKSKSCAQLLLSPRVGNDVIEYLFQFVVSVHLGKKVGEFLSRLNQLAQRLNLLHDAIRMEIIKTLEVNFNSHLSAVVGQLVINSISQPRLHCRQHLIKVVTVNLHEFTVSDSWKLFFGHSGVIAQC